MNIRAKSVRLAGLSVALAVGALTVSAGAGVSTHHSDAAAAVAHKKKPLIPVTYGVSATGIALLPQEICVSQGFCAKNGIQLNLQTILGGPAVIAAVESGSVPFAVTSSFLLFTADSQGAPLVAVSQETQGFNFEITLQQSLVTARHIQPTKSVKAMLNDIQGMSIGGLGAGTTGGLIMQGLLKKYGYPPNWVNFVPLTGVANLDAALQHGTVNGIFTSAGAGELAEGSGYGQIIFYLGAALKPFNIATGGITFTNQSYLNSHKQVVRDLVKAFDQTQAWMSKHVAQASQLAATDFSLPEIKLYATVQAENYPKTAYMPAISWRNAQDLANDYGLATPHVTNSIEHEVYTNRYFPSSN